MSAFAAFDQMLTLLEQQGHRFETYDELEAFLAGANEEATAIEVRLASAEAR